MRGSALILCGMWMLAGVPALGAESGAAETHRALARLLSAEELRQVKIPFEADERIRRLARELTGRAGGEHQKLSALLAFFKERGFEERHHRTGTLTAAEVLEQGEGNCLSYANLMVALARAAGLEAVYLDASEAASETEHRQGLLVDYGHVLVGVRIDGDLTPVDFDGEAKEFRRFRVLSDLEALADFYNNLGFERSRLGGGEQGLGAPEVIAAFELATRIRPGFARAWNNLGVALKKAGNPERAALAYRRAIAADPLLPAPHANLGHALLGAGRHQEAAAAFRAALRGAPDNAFYRFFLGKALVLAGRREEAQVELERSATQEGALSLAALELARLYLEIGRPHDAARTLGRLLERYPNHPEGCRLYADLVRRPSPSGIPPPPQEACRSSQRL